MIAWLRSAVFYVGLAPVTLLFCLLALLIWPVLPLRIRQPMIAKWSVTSLWWLRICCGVRWRFDGLERLPDEPCVLLCKHQSAWETLALCGFFPPQVWVLKRELLWVPAFGQAIASLDPIWIDRRRGASAIRHVLESGVTKIHGGFCVVIFPEGTRVLPGQRGHYARSGAQLAISAGCPIVPIAHNAGLCWPRNSFVKNAGRIDMIVGEPIRSDAGTATELTARCEAWIESTCNALLHSDSAGKV